MPFLACPLCGKMSSLKLFNPQTLDLDIYVQNVKGLGRARGFKVVNRTSALNMKSVTEPIKIRLINLIIMMNEEDIITKEELSETFGFKEEHDELTALVADALEEDSQDLEFEEEEEDKMFGILRYGIERLIENYLVLRASRSEEEMQII